MIYFICNRYGEHFWSYIVIVFGLVAVFLIYFNCVEFSVRADTCELKNCF